MKRILTIICMCFLIFSCGCNKSTLSNLDIQKLNQKAYEYMQNGEYDKAIARLEAIIDLNPNFFETYYNLGIAYYQTGDYENSLKALSAAINKKENFADAYYSRAVVYEDWGYATHEDLEGKEIKLLDKKTAEEYLNNAVSDYEKYLELKSDAQDKDEVLKKISELKKDLSGKVTEE